MAELFYVVSKPPNRPMRRLHHRITSHLVQLGGSLGCGWSGPTGQQGPRGIKNDFPQICP